MTRLACYLLYAFGFACLAAALLIITVGSDFIDAMCSLIRC